MRSDMTSSSFPARPARLLRTLRSANRGGAWTVTGGPSIPGVRHTLGMGPTDLAALFDHLYWVRDRILAAADDPAAPFVDPSPPTLRDLRATLVHELDVEWSWRVRLAGADRTAFSTEDEELVATDFPDVRAIRERWATDEAEMRAWLARLTEADLEGPCRTEASGPGHPFWFHLQHLYSHAIQQFADAAVVLTAAGRSPGELDFLDFVESTGRTLNFLGESSPGDS